MQLMFRRRYCQRSLTEATTKWVRDRGLDHAVEREKNLKPLLNIKNLIKSEPSKSLPISIIAQQKESLNIPNRPIDFIRKYPSVFHEFLPGNIGIQPHIKLTPEVLNLDAEEQFVYQSHTYKKLVADRLLKLLMISKISEIPLQIIEILKWDLGLPQDYAETIVPEFPDCFRIVGGENGKLELVCWSNELAVAVVEKKVVHGERIMFPMKFSSGFKIDKKIKKVLDDWQKLPYISPYEDASHLLVNSDESDKWAVAVLHEVLSLFGGKKVERDNVLCFGEFLGIRSRFKRVLLNYPGVFYVSNKIGMYTVVLRDGYKRGSLIESDPLMNVRSQYIHLMNTVKEDRKMVALQSGNKQQEKGMLVGYKGDEEVVSGEGVEDNDVESNDLSSREEEDVSDDDDDDDEEEEEEGMHRRGANKNGVINRGRSSRKKNFEKKGASRSLERGKSREEGKGGVVRIMSVAIQERGSIQIGAGGSHQIRTFLFRNDVLLSVVTSKQNQTTNMVQKMTKVSLSSKWFIMCKCNVETLGHLLLHCPIAPLLWNKLLQIARIAGQYLLVAEICATSYEGRKPKLCRNVPG